MSVSKLMKGFAEPNLQGAEHIAFVALAATLTNSMAQAVKGSLWGTMCSTVRAAIQGLDKAKAGEAATAIFLDAKDAMRSQAVKEALGEAGYGDLASLIETDKGNTPGGNAATNKLLVARYGPKFKLKSQIDRATNTLEQYGLNILNAIKLESTGPKGEDWWTLTVGQVVQANRLAAEKLDPAKKAARDADKYASNVGAEIAAIMRKSIGGETEGVVLMLTALIRDWKHVDTNDKAAIVDFLDPIVQYAQLAANIEAEEAKAQTDAQPATAGVAESGTLDAGVNLADMDDGQPQAVAA